MTDLTTETVIDPRTAARARALDALKADEESVLADLVRLTRIPSVSASVKIGKPRAAAS